MARCIRSSRLAPRQLQKSELGFSLRDLRCKVTLLVSVKMMRTLCPSRHEIAILAHDVLCVSYRRILVSVDPCVSPVLRSPLDDLAGRFRGEVMKRFCLRCELCVRAGDATCRQIETRGMGLATAVPMVFVGAGGQTLRRGGFQQAICEGWSCWTYGRILVVDEKIL